MNDLSATDRCVKCGLCLPHCPTFALTGNEADSPRGRISLMQALGDKDLQWSDGLFRHLDQCLLCGACEAMCPSGVPFGRLMDETRTIIESRRRRSLLNRLMRNAGLGIAASPASLHVLEKLLPIYRKTGLPSLLIRMPGLPATVRRLHRLLPAARTDTGAAAGQANNMHHGKVNLFRGCVGSVLDQQTLNAAQQLLQRLGYRVNSPAPHPCCGALHQHNGAPDAARALADANLQAFTGNDHPILVTASACSAQLRDYTSLYAEQAATAFAARVSDIMHFLAGTGRADMRFGKPEQKLAVYIPCTHRNGLKQSRDVMDVLQWLPGPEPVLINPEGGCCGAAGSYMLGQPQLSEQLGNAAAERIIASGAGIVLTTNTGCALHLQAVLQQRAAGVEVLHPVVLLERLLLPHSPRTNGT
ncbi:MAG: (Fe-S)-binding protein [Thiogranum sp.]